MKVLMFGWEFPPMKSGGLGTACFDLCRGLSRNGVEVVFVVPQLPRGMHSSVVKLIGADQLVKLSEVNTILTPYMTSKEYLEKYEMLDSREKDIYGRTMFAEVERYSKAAALIAERERFDVIHCHDWMTYEAGIIARKVSGRPLVVHIHATEFDRTGGSPNHEISKREYAGLSAADLVVANSHFTKSNVLKHYMVDSGKVKVVHWGIDEANPAYKLKTASPFRKDRVVLFLGRVTLQKGPDYFVRMAERVLQFVPDVKFVFAGSGDMFPRIVSEVAEKGIADKFVFTGFLSGDDVHRAFQMADIYVMPSVSEPFGLVALESLKNNTPVLISRQSGVSEVLSHVFKVDFWDVDEMSNKIVSFLRYSALEHELADNSFREAEKFNLDEPARKCIGCYREVLKW
jgi:glycosyltransferase involved in cell wall biosynthesis